MMRRPPEELTDLLLAGAPLLKLADLRTRAPMFAEAWRQALRPGEAEPLTLAVPEAVAKDLLRTVLALCEAAGIAGHELTALYNDRRDAAEYATAADLETLIDQAAHQIMAIIAKRMPRPEFALKGKFE